MTNFNGPQFANSAFERRGDAYTEGYCKRCGRIRTECQKIIDTGKRCIEVPHNPNNNGQAPEFTR